MICMSPLVSVPSERFFFTPPNNCRVSDCLISSYPQTPGAMLCHSFSKIFGSSESSLICLSSSSLTSRLSNVSSSGSMLLTSIARSNLVCIAPVCEGTGTSFKTPISLTLLPGVVLSSILGSTKSSFRNTEILLGCSPPSSASGDSSTTILWASTMSLLISLKPPFLTQEHLVGSLNVFSICKTEITEPHEGHSNLAFANCGLTSLACRTMTSTVINVLRCLDLRSLILIKCVAGRSKSLTRGLFTMPSSSSAKSRICKISSGDDSRLSASSCENEERSLKLMKTTFLPPLMYFPSSFL